MTPNQLLERTHYCLDIARLDEHTLVTLAGWVRKRRDLGNLIFVDLYDRSGIAQVVFDPETNRELHAQASELKHESVVTVRGMVRPRPAEALNRDMSTGMVEVHADALTVHNTSKVPPFPLLGNQDVKEELRLKYRYLDLRRSEMFRYVRIRHQTSQIVHAFLTRQGFLEITTPHLIRSTPEGARDFLVPSRLHVGSCYALQQSPQLFKQISMIAGFDRYFQIVKCFRDEDSRADRQPEFTQIDIEMSFTKKETLFGIQERLMKEIFSQVAGIDIPIPFERMTYAESMRRFGSDKPDLRFGLEIRDVTEVVGHTGFGIVDTVVASGGVVRALRYEGGAVLSRKQVDELAGIVKKRGAGGLIALKVAPDMSLAGHALEKFLDPERQARLIRAIEAAPGDLICLVAGKESTAAWSLGDLRLHIARVTDIVPDTLRFAWIVDFPMFEWDEESKRFQAMHHPFTAPLPDDLHDLETDPGRMRAQAYDLVLNGVEIGGGSVRIHQPELQTRLFQAMGISPEEAESRFGFFLEALRYGTPPHCGIAFGFDRLIMLLSGTDNLRDVIPFPKTLQAVCLMSQAPSPVTGDQLDMVGMRLRPDGQSST